MNERKKRRRKCGACGGNGVLAPAVPSCEIPGRPRSWIVVEKCDACEQFEDDLSAALSLFAFAGWFSCTSGGEHALARLASKKRQRAREPQVCLTRRGPRASHHGVSSGC